MILSGARGDWWFESGLGGGENSEGIHEPLGSVVFVLPLSRDDDQMHEG